MGARSFSTTTPRKSAQEIGKFSQKDAAKYPEFRQSLAKMGKVIGEALTLAAAEHRQPQPRRPLGHAPTPAARCANLGKKDMYRLLRWGPMAVADLVAEYFDTELLRATIAARGIFGTFLGPWSAGSSLVLLIRAAGDSHPAGSANFAEGGMGASRRPWLPPPRKPARKFAAAPKSSKFA